MMLTTLILSLQMVDSERHQAKEDQRMAGCNERIGRVSSVQSVYGSANRTYICMKPGPGTLVLLKYP